MSKIEFENGLIVDFEGDPTPQDVEEVAKSLNVQKQPQGVSGLLGVAVGTAKGAVSTITGAASLGERMLKGTTKALLPKSLESKFGVEEPMDKTSAEKLIPEQVRVPKGGTEKFGFGAEQIAEFFIPTTKIAKLEKGLSLFPRMAIEATTVGGQSALQEGEIDNEVKTSALVGAMFPMAGAVLKGAKGILKPIGEKIQQTVIRPMERDVKDGFKIANVNKYNLGGSLSETAVKTHTKINELVNELNKKISSVKNRVNLNDVFQSTVQALQEGKTKAFGDIKATQRVLESLKEEIESISGKEGLVNLVDATNIKRGAGTKGAWAYGRIEPDAGAVEKVYSTFYNRIKTAIEDNSPIGVSEINKQLSEIIPISNAVLRRLPVEQRNNVISLTDSIGLFSAMFDPRALVLIGANKLSKSGKFGAWLSNIGKAKESATAIGKRFFGD